MKLSADSFQGLDYKSFIPFLIDETDVQLYHALLEIFLKTEVIY